jgi:subtilisin family serine protease
MPEFAMHRSRPRLALSSLALAGLTGLVAAQTAASSGDATRPAALPPKPAHTFVVDGHLPGVLEVKFARDSGMRLRDGAFVAGTGAGIAVNAALADWDAVPRAMFAQPEALLESWRHAGEARSGIALHDLNLFYFVDVADPLAVGALCDRLNALDVVELAWPAPSGGDPVVLPSSHCPPPALPGGSPDFVELQGYRQPAPAGVDADWANSFSGGAGVGVTIADCETGWTDDHEDLAETTEDMFVGFGPAPYPWDHGTAVLGEMLGLDNGSGVKGICWEADARLSTHSPVGGSQNIPGSVANGAAALGPGDVLVIEIQCFGAPPAPFPCEYDPAIFATVQTATANGIHVFAAAGNGGHNLDSVVYGGAFDLAIKDSGAVIVGASSGAALVPASFSNVGSRLSSHGWGESVASTGYGDLQSGPPTQEYTATFSGTSSATPIVAGTGTVLLAIHREAFGTALEPIALRALLAGTGTPQTSGGNIGTRPNLRGAIHALGVPVLELGGTLRPGGTLELTVRGNPGDAYLVLWSTGLAATPLHLPPWGYFFLEPSLSTVLPTAGVIGPGGTSTDSYNIPPASPLSGLLTHFQGAAVFGVQPGTGSVTNMITWRLP